MGWRKTGVLRAPEAILVMTCDVCERDIGHEDGRRPRPLRDRASAQPRRHGRSGSSGSGVFAGVSASLPPVLQ